MEFLNKAYAQLADVFKSMTPGARMIAGLLLIVAVVSVAYLFNGQVAGGDAYLMGGEMFSAGQLRSMHAALGKANLEARIDGARIKVQRGQESKCMAALAEAGALPVEFGGYLEKAVTNNGFMTLNRNQEAAMKIAKQRELQNIINTMVEKSLVLIDEQSDHGFPPKTIITASVSIQPRDQQPLDENRIPAAIRYLVSSSVAGLKPEAVTVVDLSTQRTYPGSGGGENRSPGTLGEYAELKRYYEREYQEKISRLLAPYIPGVLVTTSVEFDPETSKEPTSIEDAAANSQGYESRDRAQPINAARNLAELPPGAAPNGLKQPLGLPGFRGAKNKSHEDVALPQQHGATAATAQHVLGEGRAPKRVAVSIAVPNSYYEKIWRQTNSSSAGEPARKPDAAALAEIQAAEKKKIAELVAPLLPQRDPAADPNSHVAVSTFYQFPEPPPREATFEDNAQAWLSQNSNTLGLSGLAVIGLIVLRSMIKSATAPTDAPSDAPLEIPSTLSLVGEEAHGEPEENTSPGHLRHRASRGPSLRDELSDIVRDDPEAAVTILRTWIGNAG